MEFSTIFDTRRRSDKGVAHQVLDLDPIQFTIGPVLSHGKQGKTDGHMGDETTRLGFCWEGYGLVQ
jgi:hypothetical protein